MYASHSVFGGMPALCVGSEQAPPVSTLRSDRRRAWSGATDSGALTSMVTASRKGRKVKTTAIRYKGSPESLRWCAFSPMKRCVLRGQAVKSCEVVDKAGTTVFVLRLFDSCRNKSHAQLIHNLADVFSSLAHRLAFWLLAPRDLEEISSPLAVPYPPSSTSGWRP